MMTIISSETVVVNSFTTSNAPLSLESVTLLLATSSGTGNLSVSLYGDNLGTPTGLLTTFTGNPIPAAAGDYTYTAAPGGFGLAADTTYWLRVQLTAAPMSGIPATVGWSETADLAETSAEGWTAGTKQTQTVNNGVAGAWTADTTRAGIFSLNAVPEPGSAALAALSAGLLLRRRRNGV